MSDESAVLTFRDGKVAAYSGVAKMRFSAAVDEDGNQIPDLLLPNPYTKPFEAMLRCGRRGGMPLTIPEVDIQAIAHGLPDGRFATTDSVATARARMICPARPAKIVHRDVAGNVKHVETWEAIACARLWGADEGQVRAAVDKGCGTVPDDHDACEAAFDLQLGTRGWPFCVGREWTDDLDHGAAAGRARMRRGPRARRQPRARAAPGL